MKPLPLSLVSLLVFVLAACGGGQEAATPSPSLALSSPSASPTTSASPAAKPDPQSLLQPGYVLDDSLEVNLDGGLNGHIVLITHTVRQALEGGDPAAVAIPAREGCPTDPSAELGPSACLFQAQIFAYDAASGWTRVFVTPQYRPPKPGEKGGVCGHRCGIQEVPQATKFRVDSEREALVLGIHYCTGVGSGCGGYQEVVAMQNDEIKAVYNAWQASVTLGDTSATFDNPALFRYDPFAFPSGRRIEKLALDPNTGDLAVVESRLTVCSDGTLPHNAGELYPPSLLELRCESGYPGSLYDTTDETIVEPATVGGLQGLRGGDRVRIESTVLEGCPDPQSLDCHSDTLIATKITALNR